MNKQALYQYIDDNLPDGQQTRASAVRDILKTIVDNYSPDIIDLDVPANGATVNVVTTKPNTHVCFKGVITDPFTLNIDASAAGKNDSLVINIPGDGVVNGIVITLSGNIQFTQCGGVQTTVNTGTIAQVYPHYFDGVNFSGTDNC